MGTWAVAAAVVQVMMRARRRWFFQNMIHSPWRVTTRASRKNDKPVAHAIDTFSCKPGTHDVSSRARLWSRALTFALIFHQQVDGKSRQAFREWNRPNDDSSEMQFQEFKMKRVVCSMTILRIRQSSWFGRRQDMHSWSAAGHGNLFRVIRQSWNKQSRLYSIVLVLSWGTKLFHGRND
jgi:hypothetical protein